VADLSMVFDLLAKDRASSKVADVGDSMKAAGDDADAFGDRVSGMFGKIAGVAAGAGLAVGAGFVEALSKETQTAKLGAQLGLDPAETAKAGKVAGDLYAANYGDSMETVSDAVGAVVSSIEGMRDASGAAVKTATRDALNFASAFGTDVNEAVGTVGVLIKNGLVPDATAGFDMMTAAYQKVPAAMREELPAILTEYGTNFRALGYTGEQAFGLLTSAAEGGPVVLDKVGDALKELTILVGSDLAATAPVLTDLGLDAQAMGEAIATGGAGAQTAVQQIAQALLNVKDPTDRAAQAVALFGTPLEDLSVDQIPAFLGSLANVGPGMDDTKGKAEDLDEALGNTASNTLGTFARGLQSTFVDLIGGEVLPKLQTLLDMANSGDWSGIGTGIVTAVQTALGSLGTLAGDMFTALGNLFDQIDWFGLAMKLGEQVPTMLVGLATGILNFDLMGLLSGLADNWFAVVMGILAIAFLPGKVVAKVAEVLAKIPLIGRLLAWFVTAIKKVADKVVGWVGDIIGGFARGFTAGGSRIGGAISTAFNNIKTYFFVWGDDVIKWFKALPQRFVRGAETLGLNLRIAFNNAMAAAGRAISSGISSVVNFFKGLPGKVGSALGSLGSTLYQKGKDMIQGLLNGAGSLLSSIGRFFLNKLPGWIRGPFESALGIRSPSKVFKKYGVNIGQGLIKGIDGSEKEVKAASKKLGAELVKAFHAALKNSDLASAQKALDAIDVLNRSDDKLIALAKSRDQIAKRLEVARDKLADAVKMRTDFAASVRSSALQFASLTAIKTAGSPRVLVDELQQRLTAITRFRAQLAKLAKLGVSQDVYKQIAEAGVEAGGATADALLAGGPKTIKQVNALQSKISGASKGLGSDATKRLYQAGVDAAQGLVNGLSQQSKGLAQAADRLARQLTDAVKRRLGIRSPSKVFEGVGTSIGEGLAAGIASMRPVVAAELAALADSQAVQSLQAAVDVDTGVRGAGAVGYTPPAYDTSGVGAVAAPTSSSRTVNVSGVVGPAEVAALVAREQRRDEFLAGAGT